MSLKVASEGESFLIAPITSNSHEGVLADFEPFTNPQSDEIILDCTGLDEHLERLSALTGYDTTDWSGRYVLMYIDNDL